MRICQTRTKRHTYTHAHTAAYKHADGKKIDGKRVLVDVERARTVKGWLPRRLGEFKCINNCYHYTIRNLEMCFGYFRYRSFKCLKQNIQTIVIQLLYIPKSKYISCLNVFKRATILIFKINEYVNSYVYLFAPYKKKLLASAEKLSLTIFHPVGVIQVAAWAARVAAAPR